MDGWAQLNWIARATQGQLSDSDIALLSANTDTILEESARHLVTPALISLIERRQTATVLPPNRAEYLQAVYDLNVTRNKCALDDLKVVVSELQPIDVHPILLKGIASVADGLYPNLGTRMLSDIDLLIPADRLRESVSRLQQAGWTTAQPGERVDQGIDALKGLGTADSKHLPPLYHADANFRVELHQHIVPAMFRLMLPTDDAIARVVEFDHNDQSLLRLSATDRLAHNLIHSQLDDGRFVRGLVSLRQLYEWVRLRERDEQDIDWSNLVTRFGKVKPKKALAGYLAIAAELFDQRPPPQALNLLAEGGAYVSRVRHRSKHAQSYGHVDAFTNFLSPRKRLTALIKNPGVNSRKLVSATWWRAQAQNMTLRRQAR